MPLVGHMACCIATNTCVVLMLGHICACMCGHVTFMCGHVTFMCGHVTFVCFASGNTSIQREQDLMGPKGGEEVMEWGGG